MSLARCRRLLGEIDAAEQELSSSKSCTPRTPARQAAAGGQPAGRIGARLSAGRLQRVLDAHRQHDGAFRILWPSSRHLTPKLRAFIDFLATRVFPER
ncbi:hypothetical protein [Janthinobacterium sp. BJB446]|uniref:hypothetical protein n=1 Tax=Janthinobacterium sp. BJB446 TaxID=2048009 RepID=UPI001C55744E